MSNLPALKVGTTTATTSDSADPCKALSEHIKFLQRCSSTALSSSFCSAASDSESDEEGGCSAHSDASLELEDKSLLVECKYDKGPIVHTSTSRRGSSDTSTRWKSLQLPPRLITPCDSSLASGNGEVSSSRHPVVKLSSRKSSRLTCNRSLGPGMHPGLFAELCRPSKITLKHLEEPKEKTQSNGVPEQRLNKAEDSMFRCSFCSETFAVGDVAIFLPDCVHRVHHECGRVWFAENKNCPQCGDPIETSQALLDAEIAASCSPYTRVFQNIVHALDAILSPSMPSAELSYDGLCLSSAHCSIKTQSGTVWVHYSASNYQGPVGDNLNCCVKPRGYLVQGGGQDLQTVQQLEQMVQSFYQGTLTIRAYDRDQSNAPGAGAAGMKITGHLGKKLFSWVTPGKTAGASNAAIVPQTNPELSHVLRTEKEVVSKSENTKSLAKYYLAVQSTGPQAAEETPLRASRANANDSKQQQQQQQQQQKQEPPLGSEGKDQGGAKRLSRMVRRFSSSGAGSVVKNGLSKVFERLDSGGNTATNATLTNQHSSGFQYKYQFTIKGGKIFQYCAFNNACKSIDVGKDHTSESKLIYM